MILKLIFLIMLCIPIACLQLYLVIDTAKDLKKPKKAKIRKKQSVSSTEPMKKNHLRVAK
ncbi:hypothetical protein [Crassaminicella profunda]|uniref:hypothetical protein n=1 Tax=Crassaminicella profunda TaxID=1286698 RepID=UPI001CA79C8C|nr:hypothetical protein [Crassaminicella profunda]QZY55310.1 hypothetical protein K7H06_20310 [Crassaminicella profunda]